MIVSISQPTLFSWIGYYNIIKNSDIFVFLDNVKFKKQCWQNRNKLKSCVPGKDTSFWINMPVKSPNSNILIKDVRIDNEINWKTDHKKTFLNNYGKEYEEIEFIQEIYEHNWGKLADFNIEFITECCKFLKIDTKLIKSSDLNCKGTKGDLVLDICKKFDTTEYLSGVAGKDYLEDYRLTFEKNNIKINYHDYVDPVYNQKGETFIQKLSILDLLFNEKTNAKNFI
jgi:hypothetical protein|tara:strand:- start:1106 stop:1786 length:681 start_codon:yes stop_codon:yes gene_type:complete